MEAQPKSIFSWLKIGLALLVITVAGFGIGLMLASAGQQKARVPTSIADDIAFPIFLPGKLPGNYEIDEKSFSASEETLVFSASDGGGGSIVFTEQRKPPNFDFDEFYKQQMQEAKNVDKTPSPSVLGKSTENGAPILSIVTDSTWILITSQSPVGDDGLELIARSLKPQAD